MKLRPRRRKASESPGREVKHRMPLKKRKEKSGDRLNRRSVKSDGLVEKNVEVERNQDEDPGTSNSGPSRHGCSRRQASTVSRSSVFDIENGPGSGVGQLLEEVLLHILGLLTFADMKSARLVNKHWRQVGTTLLRRSSKMIRLDRSVSDCITKMGDGQFPVNRFDIPLGVDRSYARETKICLASIPRICLWAKELTLSVDIARLSRTPELSTFPTDCVYEDLTQFNLQLIQFTDLRQESCNRFKDFVRRILEKFPNLREVNVVYYYVIEEPEKFAIYPLVENLFPIPNSVGTSKLSSINFENVPLERIDLAKWSTLNLKLRKLGLNVSCFSSTNDLLAKFLDTQTGTLKDLTLKVSHREPEEPAMPFKFPRLEKLEQLLVICDYSYAVVTFAGIDYTRLFPSLKKLDLSEDRAIWRDVLGNGLVQPTNTVEEIIFPNFLDDRVGLTANPAVTAAKIFTGLKKLKIYVDRLFTEATCMYENMPNLEVLTVSKAFGTYDDIITGLERAVCRKFRGVVTEEWIKKLQNAEGQSMARLENLKTLKLKYCGLENRLCLSRLSLHVFKKMCSLKCLDLFNGCAATAERCSADKGQRQFLEELRANFVVL